ncbi:futalosine hydrolase [Streptomyces sp. NBC_00572]|uniref:futalosine hydrolase n=1 Tax=Streptomyces sp. NBC_00572 TaxID=2903664 RepID=UPI002250B920|nr:futalosine hydrolase [Streptomyces sp. NBC_00572]MCX4982583.1 futalosine hydrolase [Streptomyces sp. NBC_00572]
MVHRILIVTAVAAEADSVSAGLGLGGPELLPLPGGLVLRRHTDAPGGRVRVDVLVGGVGPAAVAASTGTALAYASLTGTENPRTENPYGESPYGLVVSAGIAGGFRPLAPLGSVVVSSAVVAADLGAETPDGYLAVDELGFGRSVHPVPEALTGRVAAALDSGGRPYTVAPVLTVSTVTGTAGRAAELAGRHPGAAAEAMEGFGVAEAAAAYGVPVVEIRAVSNAVGPRDRAAWRIGEALDALRHAFELLSKTVFVELEPS